MEFTPSPDHNALDSSGTPIVTSYSLLIYVAGASTPTQTVNLGKPAPDTDGKIRVDFVSLLSTPLTPNVTYEGRVSANGPGGSTPSSPSNDFTFTSGCAPIVSPTSQNPGSGGGSFSASVTLASTCAWSATSNASWITITAGASGMGSGTVAYSVAANTSTSTRTGTLTIAGVTLTVTQAGLSCSYTISPTSKAFATAGESAGVAVTAPTGCAWSTTNNLPWVTVTGGSGSGNGTVTLAAAANTGTSGRSGTITIAGKSFNATQAGITCNDTISPTSKAFAIAGESTDIAVTAPGSCSWTANSNSSWLSVTAGASGMGNGTVTVTAAANTGSSSRTGSVTIAGKTFNATQAALVCNDTITPGSQAFATDGESTTVAVSAPAGCNWTATSNAAWITVTAGSSGSGDGAVTLKAAANTSPASRSGTVTIAGKTFNATQAGINCTDTIAPGTKDFTPSGESTTVAVTAAAGCTWGATSNASWVTVTAGSSGSGNGTVTLKAAANPSSAPRSGTVTIAGNTFNATQDGVPCTETISPGAQTFAAAGGNGNVAVTAPIGCTWTAGSNDTWLTITAGATGSGSGTVTVKADSYTGTTSRTGSATIAGNTFNVTQSGAACSYAISPTSQPADADGDSGTITVTAAVGCGWTATSNAGWITITSATSGDGPGSVTFTVAANASASTRSGTISVGGKTFTVNQAATACVVTIGSSSRSFTSSSGTGTVTVSAPAGCSWSATSSATSWLKVTSGVSGSGNGTVGYSVSANSSTSSRTGTLTIGGNPFTVTQSGASCTITISPTTRSVSAAAASGTISVSAGAGCAWSATSSASWLTITGNASGTGNGSVAYAAAANNTPSVRSATITVAGKTFKLTQAAGSCSFTVSPNPLLLANSGGGGTLTVTTSPGCSWRVSSSPVAWLAIVGSGSASGTATYFASGYTGDSIRKTTLTVAGQSIQVIQGAPPPPAAPSGFRIVGR